MTSIARGSLARLKNNVFIVAAVALPLVVVLFLLATAVARWRVPAPQYDFVFNVGASPAGAADRSRLVVIYGVKDGRVAAHVAEAPDGLPGAVPELYLFDHERSEVRRIPFTPPTAVSGGGTRETVLVEALRDRRVVDPLRAPDGYVLRDRVRPAFFGELFGSRRQTLVHLEHGGRVVSLPLPAGGDRVRYSSPTPIGWLDDGGR